jgi:hypothetical protein
MGRYINPEENSYEENLPASLVPHYNFSQVIQENYFCGLTIYSVCILL